MLTLEEKLDNELDSIKPHTEEGLAKIKLAQELLPIHYKNIIDSIGGEITDKLDYDRLPKSIAKLAMLFNKETPALGESTNTMIATLVYTNLYGKFRPYINDTLVSRKSNIPCNVFVVNIASSGSGKDSSFDLGSEVMKEPEKLVYDAMCLEAENKAKNIARAKSKKAQEKAGIKLEEIMPDDNGWEQFYNTPMKGEIKMATYEALLAESENIEKNGKYGNIFIRISELGNSLKLDPNIDRLIMLTAEMYDMGKAPEDLKKTKELKTGAIEGLGISLLAHTSPAPLMKDQKLVDKLKSIVGSYFGRRAYVMVTSLDESTKDIELSYDLDEQANKMRELVHHNKIEIDEIEKSAIEGVSRLLNGKDLEKITLSDDASTLYAKYFIINKYYRSLAYMKSEEFVTDGLLTELTNRHWRAVKVAGIWALAENSSVITTKIMASAIYYTEFAGRGLRKLFDTIDLKDFERFIKAIDDKDIGSTIRFDTLIKQSYITKADKTSISNLLTSVNSALQGRALVTADYTKSIVKIDVIEEAKGEYGTSVLQFHPTDSKEYRKDKSYKGFIYKKHKLEDLVLLLQKDYVYSPFKFKDGRRSNDNVESETNYIALDVDNSDIDMDILHQTYLSGTSHIVSTTSDNTNMRKFRLIIPIQQKIGKNPQVYKYVLNRVAAELMLDIDPASTVLSQVMFSYSGSKVLHNLDANIPPMDISDILRDSTTSVPTVDYSTPLTKAQQLKEQQLFLHDFEDTFSYVINCNQGRGSILLYSTMRRLERSGLDRLSIETLLHKINSSWAQPMDRKRLEQTIFRQIRIKE